MSDLEQMLAATPAQSEPQGTPEPTQPTGNESEQTGTPQTPTPDDDFPQGIREYLEQNPDHRAIAEQLNRQFQSAFTPKLQKAAELQKMVDGLDPETLNGIRYLQQMASQDPARAAMYLRQQADLLHQAQAEQAAPVADDPYDGYEPATDVEAFALQKIREMDQWRQRQEQEAVQRQLQAEVGQIRHQATEISKEFGIQIADHEIARAWDISRQTGLPFRNAFFALQQEQLLPKMLQRARDEASSVVNQKASTAGIPSNLTPRTSDVGPQGPRGLAAYLDDALNGL